MSQYDPKFDLKINAGHSDLINIGHSDLHFTVK